MSRLTIEHVDRFLALASKGLDAQGDPIASARWDDYVNNLLDRRLRLMSQRPGAVIGSKSP